MALVTFSDDFSGSFPGTNWTNGPTAALGDMEVVSGAAQAAGTGTDRAAFWSGDTYGNDQYAEAEVQNDHATTSGDSWVGLVTRGDDSGSGDCYITNFIMNNVKLETWKLVSGSWTQIGGTSFISHPNSGGRFHLRNETIGTTIKTFIDGVERKSHTDSSLSTGEVGIHSYTGTTKTDVKFYDFQGGDFDTSKPNADVKFAIVRGTDTDLSSTTNGNADFTSSGFGTPKACIVWWSELSSGTGTVNGANGMLGFAVGTGAEDEYSIWFGSEHNASSAGDTYRRSSEFMAGHHENTGSRDGWFSFKEWITDGVRFNVDNTFASNNYLTVLLIGGDDISVAAGNDLVSTSDGGTVNISPGFETNLLMLLSTDKLNLGTGNTSADTSFRWRCGFMTYDGTTIRQASVCQNEPDNQANGDPQAIIRSDRVGTNVTSGSENYSIEATAVGATTVTLTTRGTGSGTTAEQGWLAINLPSTVSAHVTTHATPSATGSTQLRPPYMPGWKPQCMIQLFTLLALGTEDGSAAVDRTAGGMGIGFNTADDQYAHCWSIEDGSATTDTQTEVQDRSVLCDDDDGSGELSATFTSFDNGGATQNYTSADSVCRFVTLMIQEAEAVGGGSGQPIAKRKGGQPAGSLFGHTRRGVW